MLVRPTQHEADVTHPISSFIMRVLIQCPFLCTYINYNVSSVCFKKLYISYGHAHLNADLAFQVSLK